MLFVNQVFCNFYALAFLNQVTLQTMILFNLNSSGQIGRTPQVNGFSNFSPTTIMLANVEDASYHSKSI